MRCLICQGSVEHNALSFWGERICCACEESLMNSAPEDLEYEAVVDAFRLLWQRQAFTPRGHQFQGGEQL